MPAEAKQPKKIDRVVASIIKSLANIQIVGAILIIAFLIYEFFVNLT